MFNPSVAEGGPATATRSRRRQRPKSTDSLVQQPKAKRQRLPLAEQTFTNTEPEAQPEMVQAEKAEKVTVDSKQESPPENPHRTPRKDLNVRAKKSKHGDRVASKGDRSFVLNSTSAFTVSKLPALPDRIRSDCSGSQQADIFSNAGYALSLTATHAIVWAYNSTSQSPETFTFTLPSASKPSDPLPVGCLVSPSASSTEPGLVVVMSGSGKVVFWESISSAATFAFIKKDRSGVEHVISGMSSGEKVVAITNAESAGFVLTFNTGRLAYMSVRDSHGRPAISVQFLRANLSPTSGGLFGSIRHAFSHLSLRGDIAAVRADRSSRVGERNIVALTSKGKIQAWKIHRGGHNEPIGEADMRDELVHALQQNDPFSKDYPADSFEALDFTYVPKGLEPKYLELSRLSDAMATDNPLVQHLLLLVCLTKRSVSRYVLVEVIMTPKDCQIGMIRPITSYSTAITASDPCQTVRPRVYLPRPALVAFAVFSGAAVIASVATPPESPDSQLQLDNHILTPSFEDVVDFQVDSIHEIVGSGFEEAAPSSGYEESRSLRNNKIKNPAVVLMVRGAGVVRIVTTDVEKFASEQPPQVSAKSKIEQAVFFGSKKDSPLIFDKRPDVKFTNEQISEAALQVSHEILSSTTTYITTLPASMEDNLVARSNALQRLMQYLNTIGADLARKTRWSLLYNAEKMHVAALLWKRHEAFTASRAAEDKKSIIGLIVEFIHQDQKNNPVASIGEVDRVRHWFVNDVFRLEILVTFAYQVIKVLYADKLLDDIKVNILINEAVEINVTAQVGAHEFRKSHLSLYGLGKERLRTGILQEDYRNLPEPWTGCTPLANGIKRLTDLCGQWLKKHEHLRDGPSEPNMPDPVVVRRIFDGLPVLTDAMLTSVLECARWGMANSADRTTAEDFAKAYDAYRNDKPIALARAGKWEQAAAIADKHGCLSALAVILLEHIEVLETSLGDPSLSDAEVQSLKNLRRAKTTELEDNFARCGEPFAFPVYEYLLSKHGVESVLEFDLDTLGFKTKFLRSRPELARISWINDIQQEKDVYHAANTLLDLALRNEDQVWRKKIELSLGKLALLAELEAESREQTSFKAKSDDARRDERLRQVDNELIVVRIQDQLYNQIAPCTRTAVDRAAALAFALDAHSTNIPRRQRALLQLFSDGMQKLLDHQALAPMCLIDLLTLVSLKPEARDEIADPFWLALKVADNSCRPGEIKQAKRLIWRRLFIRDDWAKINDTQLKDDREVVERLAETELFAMLTDCIRYQDPRDPFHPMPPQEALGVFTDQLDSRFQGFAESEQSKLTEAMKWEDKLLGQYIEKNRLVEWLRATFEAAQIEVENTVDEATRAGASADPSSSMHGHNRSDDNVMDSTPSLISQS
ncbi:nuclear pore complex subunit Nup133 [Metarhizium album ARSEF 1941]|uniref:Nuclear pore complex subunit Nup133 n=1 Tax=Metarhizium album (strain ARSEF 1941) TaxID=1081103 RepID=A0A0B2WTH1_METAS|nr:nuclear pore complex subunit Nup133 [Metarhizium album ARSEF 1941]KHN96964.1 nuclear pore complex subunit Nup133 [Metarhizium album ARSEF 1941]